MKAAKAKRIAAKNDLYLDINATLQVSAAIRCAYTTSTEIFETWFFRSFDRTSSSSRRGSTPTGIYRRNTMRPLSSYSEELCLFKPLVRLTLQVTFASGHS